MSSIPVQKLIGFLAILVIVSLSYLFPTFIKDKDIDRVINEVIRTPSPTPTVTPIQQEVLSGGLYRVSRIVDGDTIVVTKNGMSEKVRLIGVDTPESVDPRKPVECFGKEAAEYLKQLIENKNVTLETDPTQSKYDRYGRLLAYVFLEDGTNINVTLLTDGYAYEYTYDNPYRYQGEFKSAQQKAQELGKGLWNDAACGGEKGS